MQNLRVVSLLNSLSKKEKIVFLQYLRSPFFNYTRRLIRLAEYLIKTQKPEKEKAFQYIHETKKSKYDDLAMRHVMMRLLDLLKNFIAYQTLFEDKLVVNLYLLKGLRKKNQSYLHKEILDSTQLLTERSALKDDTYYYYCYKLELEKNTLQQIGRNRIMEPNLPSILQSINELYLYTTLKYYCHTLNQKNVYANIPEMLFKEEFLKHLKVNDYKHNPGILIYHNIMLTLTDGEDEKHYTSLKALLNKYVGNFSKEEAREMYVFAQNFCIKQINKGNSKYLKKIFELYKTTLETEIVFENDCLSPQSFKNIVATALRLKKLDWCKKFIKNYHNRIIPEHKQNAYKYNMARLFFYEKKYKNCLQLLQEVNYKDAFYGFDSKVLLLKTFYEQKDYEALEHFILSFWMFVKRNKHLSETHKKSYLHLMSFIRKIVRIGGDKIKLKKIREEIKNTQPIADANWLIEMIEVK